MATKDKFNVDQILEKLLSVRGAQPGKMVELTEAQITGINAENHVRTRYQKYFTQVIGNVLHGLLSIPRAPLICFELKLDEKYAVTRTVREI